MKINFDTQSTAFQNILDRIANGEKDAKAALIVHAQWRLEILANSMLKNYPRLRHVTHTSDVVQEVNIRLLKALEQEVTMKTPRDFLCLAAWKIRNLLVDLTRKKTLPLVPLQPDQGANIDENPITMAMWDEFHTYVQSLPENDREYFDLLYYHGLTQEQAAKMIEISLYDLKKHWATLRSDLGNKFGFVF